MIAFGSLQLYAKGDISLWFLGCLLAYPCFEMVRVVFSRAVQGNSPLQSGDDHLHNYAYKVLRDLGWHRTLANSVTGCFFGPRERLRTVLIDLSRHGCHRGYHVLAGIFSRVRGDTLCVCSTP